MALNSGFQKSKSAPVPTQTFYTSKPIDIPADFLTGPSALPITSKPVPFAPKIPEYAPYTALTIDNVLSPEECTQLLALVEASVPGDRKADDGSSWKPALVNLGPGWEAAIPGYRESDRIIWDEQTVVDRIWARCTQAEGIDELFARAPSTDSTGKWEFRWPNKRMRFLKYSPGNFFKAHCDGPYYYFENNTEFRTHYTLQLYLNDSKAESKTGDGHVGGATSFLSNDEKRRLDVNPKAGSVLIFQHAKLLHEGALVTEGIKYAMRTDMLYEWVDNGRAGNGKEVAESKRNS